MTQPRTPRPSPGQHDAASGVTSGTAAPGANGASRARTPRGAVRRGSIAPASSRSPGSSTRRRVRDAVSAGGVVFRDGDEGIEIVLVGRADEGLWALPKGTPEAGETVEETALREVREETGLEVEIVQALGDISYWFTEPDGIRVHKVVHHFLMEPVGGSVEDHDEEFDVVRWCHLAEAERLLTHQNQRPLLHQAEELIARLPL